MLYVYASMFGAAVSVLIYLLNEIRLEGAGYDMWADGDEVAIAAHRLERKYKGKIDRAQAMLNQASAISRDVRREMKVWDDKHLHESLNQMMRFSWPKTTEVVMKPNQLRQLIAA